jgi:hypothetical protein
MGKMLIIPTTSWWGFPCKWGSPHIGLPGSLPHTMLFAPTTHMMSSNKISWNNGGIGMDNNSCILFENYMVYCFKTMLYCCMLIRKLVVFVVNNLMYLLYLLWIIYCICMIYLFVNLWSLFDLLWCIVGCDCCFRRRWALYNGASGEGTLLALVKSL